MYDKEFLRNLSEKAKTWEEQLQVELKKFPERSEKFSTRSGIEIKRVYTPLDLEVIDYLKDLACQENTRSQEEFKEQCIVEDSGPCASMLALVQPRKPITGSNTFYSRVKLGCLLHSICQLKWVMIRTIHSLKEKLVVWVLQSIL